MNEWIVVLIFIAIIWVAPEEWFPSIPESELEEPEE